ncbi:MAG TPA: hypothetical protein VNN17_09555 [Terriglobia bacterium]|nr:hypothetical protein [Terriglobia bacterium]
MDAKSSRPRQRRSGRLRRQLPLQVSGIDALGADFTAPARTLMLSRFGAEILVNTELIPDQEISVGLLGRCRDWDARVVGLYARRPDGFAYGIEFLYEAGNFWGIQFPPPPVLPASAESAQSASEAAPAKPAPVSGPALRLPAEPFPAVSAKNYAIRLKCPLVEAHGALPGRRADDDQWVVLHQRQETLQQVLETAWDFTCPVHGAQREYPLEAREADAALEFQLVRNGLGGRAGLLGIQLPETGKTTVKSRRERRTPEAVRVWVQGVDRNGNRFRQTAVSLDISRHGARLDGLGLITYPGSTIEVRRLWRKARFRVVWTGKRGTPQANQIGIRCLEPGKNVWNIPDDN